MPDRRPPLRRRVTTSLAAAALVASCGERAPEDVPEGSVGRAEPDVTFHRDIAPLVYEKCTPCHRPGEAAPFAFLDHDDVQRRARQIVEVTETRFMPPWLPARGVNDFVGDRSLSEDEIALFRAWYEAGKPEGDPADAPPPPDTTPGWFLGEPDLVVRMPRDYELAADGRDVYRNFVVPVRAAVVRGTRYVRAVDFHPTNRPVVHHLALFVDRTGAARRAASASPEPGYPGMGTGEVQLPDDQFVGWAPGKVADAGEPGIAWRLEPGMDLVLQLHMRPSGKPEPVNVDIGLYFADEPPTKRPVSIRLMSRTIDIPAGDASYVVEDSYELPVDLAVLGVYPHAHYLGRELRGFATLPDGDVRTLIDIPRWDFNWQDQYRYRTPLELPRGSVLTMRYVYDNSAENPLNPFHPPQRVAFGPESVDEMGELLLQVLTSDEDLPLLWRDFARKQHMQALEYFEHRAQDEPDQPVWRRALANHHLRIGNTKQAIESYLRLVALLPEHPEAHYLLGHAYVSDGDLDAAVSALERALELAPTYVAARVELGDAHRRAGRPEEAAVAYDAALALAPTDVKALDASGELRLEQGDPAGARERFEHALAADPDDTRAMGHLGRLALAAGDAERALELGRRALEVYPDEASAHHLVALALEAAGRPDEALHHAQVALDLSGGDPAAEELVTRLRTRAVR